MTKFPVFGPSFFLLALVVVFMIMISPVSAGEVYNNFYSSDSVILYNNSESQSVIYYGSVRTVADMTAFCSPRAVSGEGEIDWFSAGIPADPLPNTGNIYQVIQNSTIAGWVTHTTTPYTIPNGMNASTVFFMCDGGSYAGYHFNDVYMRVYAAQNKIMPLINTDFTATPTSGVKPLSVTFSGGSPSYLGKLWDFGDGYTSTESSPTHIYSNVGRYSPSLTISGNTTTKPLYISVFAPGNITSEYHIDVDIRDTYGAYVPDSNVGIWDGSAWYNATSPTGSTGFIHHGLGGMLPISLNSTYTLKAWKDDYSSASQTVTVEYDHYPVTLTLTPDYTNGTLISKINVDIKDKAQGKYIQNVNVSLYRYSNSTWKNYTCPSGACGFRDEAIGARYDIWASAAGYVSNFTSIIHNNNWEIYTLSLDPLNPFDQNITLHMDIDVRNYSDNYPVTYADLGLYDPAHDEWRNTTCVSGACGFTSTGQNGQYPLKLYQPYYLSVRKTGYLPEYQSVYMSYDHQLFTILMKDTQMYPVLNGTTFNISYSGPVLNLNWTNITFNPNTSVNISAIQFPTIPTLPPTLPALPAYLTVHGWRDSVAGITIIGPYIAYPLSLLVAGYDWIKGLITFFITILSFPIAIVTSSLAYVVSLLVNLLTGYATGAQVPLSVMNQFLDMLPDKIKNALTIGLAFDTLKVIMTSWDKITGVT